MDSASRVPPPLPDTFAALRILDANRNRATEGLRVVEDYCRFALNDRHLTERCKRLRHDLAEILEVLAPEHLAAARQTEADVGAAVTTPQEQTRQSLAHIASASWQRLQQALRVLEECLKLVAPASAGRVESLRYQSYTLFKACTISADSQVRLAGARLYVLIDGAQSECAFAQRAQDLIAAGVHILQLRDKNLDDRTLLSRARLLRQIIDDAKPRPVVAASQNSLDICEPPVLPRSGGPLFILNDRPDLAVLARADGVHVGQEELSVHDVRQIVGPQMLVGVSTHNLEQARQAVLDGANYLGCGPTFPSATKHFDRFPGLDFLKQVAAEISLPAFAIGGITRENLPQVLATGSRRVAVGEAIAASSDANATANSFLTYLGAV